MSLFKSLSIDDIRQRGTIREDDVRSMRRWMEEDGAICALEADLLVTVHPSFLLRVPDEDRDDAYRRFVADLELIRPYTS